MSTWKRGLAGAERLEWDSSRFGFEVFSVRGPDADDETLAKLLEECRARGAKLVYWAAAPGRSASSRTLGRFRGALVDEKRTYGRELSTEGEGWPTPGRRLIFRREPEPEPALLNLALAAGEFSRFRLDPLMPDGVFHTLYEAWIRRSCAGEFADAVIEARSEEGGLEGMVTVAIEGEVGSIGLIAVDALARGRGLGRDLVREAERFMRLRGASRATVVTQGANTAACRLYEACGYGVIAASSVHHFWLS